MAATDQSVSARGASGPDAGALDNRLSLDPNDPAWKDTLDQWEDGQEYTVTLKITQISPGEFEVTDLSEAGGGGEEAGEPAGETEGGESEPAGGMGGMMGGRRPNRAVRAMMQEG